MIEVRDRLLEVGEGNSVKFDYEGWQEVAMFNLFSRRLGRGNLIMRLICQTADQFGVRIVAHVLAHGKLGLNDTRLLAWYRYHGFKYIRHEQRYDVIVPRIERDPVRKDNPCPT